MRELVEQKRYRGMNWKSVREKRKNKTRRQTRKENVGKRRY